MISKEQLEFFDEFYMKGRAKTWTMRTLHPFWLYHFFSESPRDMILEVCRSPGKVLDVGCGDGKYTLEAANLSFCECIGVDISSIGIKRATKSAKKLGLSEKASFLVADVHHLPFRGGLFDIIFSIKVLHHLKDPANVLGEISRLSKIHAKLLCVEPVANNPLLSILLKTFTALPLDIRTRVHEIYEGNAPHTYMFTSQYLKRILLKRGYSIQKEQKRWLFMFLIIYAGQLVPEIERIFPKRVFNSLCVLERKLEETKVGVFSRWIKLIALVS